MGPKTLTRYFRQNYLSKGELMNPIQIHYHIRKEVEGSYFTIPFSVPEGMEQLSLSYQYPESGIVDLGLINESGQFLGWSGSARKTIWVATHSATPGYRMVPIIAGQWQIIIGAYKIPTTGLDVTYTITFEPQTSRWFKGDLHVHSDASDGQHDIPTLAKAGKKKGLDFIAVANHNNYSENLHLPKVSGITLIPAVEWTHYKGHMNFYGVPAPFDNFIANSEQEMVTLVNEAKRKGALVSVCHPCEKNCGYSWGIPY